jgi:hypothetical protein
LSSWSRRQISGCTGATFRPDEPDELVVAAPELAVVEPATVADDGVCVDGESSSDVGISFGRVWSGGDLNWKPSTLLCERDAGIRELAL